MAAALDFQVFAWDARDAEGTHLDIASKRTTKTFTHIIDAYGRTADGRTVCAHVTFMPYFFVSIEGVAHAAVARLKDELAAKLGERSRPRVSTVRRKRFYGFTDGALESFLLLRFPSMKAMRRAAVLATEAGHALSESNVPPVLRLLHVRDLPSVGWVSCTAQAPLDNGVAHARKCTTCDLEFVCDYRDLHPLAEPRTDNAPLVVASFDIECISECGGFPNALEPGCPIIMIATTFWRITEPEPYRRHLACLGSPEPSEGVDTQACTSESELLVAWANALRSEQADILTGYNIFGFDLKYCFDRAAINGALGPHLHAAASHPAPPIKRFAFLVAGKRTDHMAEMQMRKLESSAYGANEFYTPTTPGMLQLDLLAIIKKEYKLGSYKLDAVASHFLGDRKVDLPIKEMFALYKSGTPAALRTVAEYCVKDTELPIRLLRKLAILPNMMEMAKAVHVPLDFLVFRGQQIKVFSIILKRARAAGYVCPTKPLINKTEKYTGATVLEAKVGAHFGHIACLDFASLYPSIIRAHNMCHSTIVLDEARYGRLDGKVEYATYDLGDGSSAKFAVAYTSDGSPVPSLLPAMLADLAEYRAQARRLQKQAKEQGDGFLESLYNGKQLAYKVTMNSLYGFCGAANGLLPCVPIAATVTTIGRNMIDATRKQVEQYYAHLGAKVIYGDSVAGYTPVLVRAKEGHIACMAIEDLALLPGAGTWQRVGGGDKEACELEAGTEAWTEAGWTPIQRVLRHACGKPLVRVVTAAGIVDVTEDHSLLLQDGTPIAPRDVKAGTTQLMHAPLRLPPGPVDKSLTAAQARIMGMYFGGGTRRRNNESWALVAKTREALAPYKQLCEQAYPCQSWSVFQTAVDGRLASFSLLPTNAVGPWLAAYDEVEQDDKVPMAVILGPPQVRAAFLQGLKDSGMARIASSGYWAVAPSSHLAAMTIAMLAQASGKAVLMRSASATSIELEFGPKPVQAPHAVQKVFALPQPPAHAYVYDLTTGNHHFHAGIGSLIVHNTDSVMCDFGVDDLAEAFRLGEEAAQRITANFKAPICLEFEKCQSPFLLYSKKRYASLKYTSPDEPGSVDAKGISIVRRDSCALVRNTTKQALDLILIHRDPEQAGRVIKDAAARLLAGQVPVEELVMSKALRGSYKAGILQPHDVVRSKIAARSPGEEPRPGDRVEFVYVEGDDMRQNVTCRAEDPAHVLATGAKVDYLHYLSLLKSALADTVEVLSPDLDGTFGDIGEEAFVKARKFREAHASNVRKGQTEMTSFFAPAPAADPFVDDGGDL
ncbi:hypothetical protein COO60DRAFT_1643784 [Scenedesmus sp. NREL 46B-D3]|nr:hypothetical protein COO60DRAFT_1643784 [Scenedesmus sp. NREL 46B-D3]